MGLKGKSHSLGFSDLNVDGLITGQVRMVTGLDITADVTLSTDQCTATYIGVTTGSASKSVIIPAAVAAQYPGKIYILANADSSLAAAIKVAGGTAVSVAASKTAMVIVNFAGTEVVRVTGDA